MEEMFAGIPDAKTPSCYSYEWRVPICRRPQIQHVRFPKRGGAYISRHDSLLLRGLRPRVFSSPSYSCRPCDLFFFLAHAAYGRHDNQGVPSAVAWCGDHRDLTRSGPDFGFFEQPEAARRATSMYQDRLIQS